VRERVSSPFGGGGPRRGGGGRRPRYPSAVAESRNGLSSTHAAFRRSFLAVSVATLILSWGAAGAEPIWPATTTPPQINVTTDSAPGWLPTAEQMEQVKRTTSDFLAAKEAGRVEDAYALLAEGDKKDQPFEVFADRIARFNRQAGPATETRIVKVTWTKDPAQAPAPGVYAALDITGRYENIDRYCGYIVLYQAPTGGGFRVAREEANFLDNATARTIEKQHSRVDVDKAWSQLIAHCPNYPADELPPLAEQPGSSVGYPTVVAALRGVRSRPGVEFSSQAGWTVASDNASATLWSFAPAGDPAYPAVVKRQIVPEGGGSSLKMDILCESTKAACDNLVREFQKLNEQMLGSLKHK
jgi:hypothetical protein